MFLPSPSNTAAAAAVLAPAGYTLLSGLRLAALRDDPAFPELAHAAGVRASRAAFLCAVVAAATAPWPPAACGALYLLRVAAGYPLRRELGWSRRGLASHVAWNARAGLAMFGLALLVVAAPVVVLAQPRPGVAAAAFAAILAWYLCSERVARALLGARPLEPGALLDRFRELAGRADTPPPSVHVIHPRSPYARNALAFRHGVRPAVAMGHELLEKLDEDEAVAVFAHEVGHLERHRYGVARAAVRGAALAAAAALVPAAVLQWIPGRGAIVAAMYPAALLVALLAVAARRRRRDGEVRSDLRAAELVGDAELVVRALEKVHRLNHAPRRLAAGAERGSTHPSLARRAQALRGPGAGAVLEAPVAAASVDAGSWVVLDRDRAHWFRGVPGGTPGTLEALGGAAAEQHTLAYREVTELRVAARGGRRALRLVPRMGAPWSVPLRAGDVPAVQAALDVVDARLAPAPAGWRLALPAARFAAAACAVVALATLAPGAVPVTPLVLAGVAALAAPLPGTLAALGGIVLLMLGMQAADGGIARHAPPVLDAVLAGVVLWAAFRGARTAPEPAWERWVPAGLLALAALYAVLVVAGDVGKGPGWQAGPGAALVAALVVGAGAALGTRPGRRSRVAAPLLVAAGFALAAPWWGRGIELRDVAAAPAPAAVLPPGTAGIRVSGDGALLAAVVRPAPADGADDDEESDLEEELPTGTHLLVGPVAGPWRSVAGDQAEWTEDGRLLVLQRMRDSTVLRLEPGAAAGAPEWRHVFPRLLAATLAVDGVGGGWTVEGSRVRPAGRLVYRGGLDGGPPVESRGRGGSPEGRAVPLPGGATLSLVRAHEGGSLLSELALLDPPGYGWEVRRAARDGTRSIGRLEGLDAACAAAPGGATCHDAVGRHVVLWRVAGDGVLRRVGVLPADRYSVELRGGMATASDGRGRVLLVDAARGRGVRIARGGPWYPMEAHAFRGGVAVLATDGSSRAVLLYRARP